MKKLEDLNVEKFSKIENLNKVFGGDVTKRPPPVVIDPLYWLFSVAPK